jgi:hypothetical protein
MVASPNIGAIDGVYFTGDTLYRTLVTSGHCHSDAVRTCVLQGFNCHMHGKSRGKAIIYQYDLRCREVWQGLLTAEILHSMCNLGRGFTNSLLNLFFAKSKPRYKIVVESHGSIEGHGSVPNLRIPWQSDLAYNRYVHGKIELLCKHLCDWDSTRRYGHNQGFTIGVSFKHASKNLSRVVTVSENTYPISEFGQIYYISG